MTRGQQVAQIAGLGCLSLVIAFFLPLACVRRSTPPPSPPLATPEPTPDTRAEEAERARHDADMDARLRERDRRDAQEREAAERAARDAWQADAVRRSIAARAARGEAARLPAEKPRGLTPAAQQALKDAEEKAERERANRRIGILGGNARGGH